MLERSSIDYIEYRKNKILNNVKWKDLHSYVKNTMRIDNKIDIMAPIILCLSVIKDFASLLWDGILHRKSYLFSFLGKISNIELTRERTKDIVDRLRVLFHRIYNDKEDVEHDLLERLLLVINNNVGKLSYRLIVSSFVRSIYKYIRDKWRYERRLMLSRTIIDDIVIDIDDICTSFGWLSYVKGFTGIKKRDITIAKFFK